MGDGGVGVALWTTPGLYSFLYTSTTLYIYLSLRRAPCRGSTTLQPLQPSTTIQLYILYTLQPSTTPLRRAHLEEKISIAARMMLPLEAVAERGPVQCTQDAAYAQPVDPGGRRARGGAEGRERCCCGFRECCGDRGKGAATLWGVGRWGSRGAPVSLLVLDLPVNLRR